MANYPGCAPIDLKSVLVTPKELAPDQVYKCRVIYGSKIAEITYEPYIPREISQYYLAVCPNDLDYSFKFTDRTFFDEARKKLRTNEDYIYVRHGLITDTSYANLVFTDGTNYYTPSEPLLKGTKRSFYLKEGRIRVADIKVEDLVEFKSYFIINAMLDMGATPVFSCDKLLLSHNYLKLWQRE
jgi:4-amino-4-deoxychorismate lyase